MNYNAHIGKRVRIARDDAAWSAVELAAALRISRQMLHRYEAGKATIPQSRLKTISRCLGVPVEWLLTEFLQNGKQATSTAQGGQQNERNKRTRKRT